MPDSMQNILREAADRLIQTVEHLGRVASMSSANSAASSLPATSSVVAARKNKRDLKQPGRRAKWTPTGSVLTKPATSAHVSDVVHMAFRTSNVWICGPQVNVSIQSNLFRSCAHLTLFCTNVWTERNLLFTFSRFSVNSTMASAGKNPWVEVFLKCFWTVICFKKHYLTRKGKGFHTWNV